MSTRTDQEIKGEVRDAYGQIARRFVETPARASCCAPAAAEVQSSCCGSAPAVESGSSCCGSAPAAADERSGCCSPAATEAKPTRLGYTPDQMSDLPESVTEVSLGCGNPTALASLQPGEVVLDLGSGGGIDCFIAAKKVGPTGRVIGLDMTPDMIRLARHNAKQMGVRNVDFRFGEMEEMPLPDDSVDVIISNCVINLSPDKDAVFAEAFRVLKPGARMSVSDMVTHGALPDVLGSDVMTWAGCIAGALDESVYLDKMRAAGLTDVEVTKSADVSLDGFLESEDVRLVLSQLDPPVSIEQMMEQLTGKISSVTVTARKP